jgi:hypothetical protein
MDANMLAIAGWGAALLNARGHGEDPQPPLRAAAVITTGMGAL